MAPFQAVGYLPVDRTALYICVIAGMMASPAYLSISLDTLSRKVALLFLFFFICIHTSFSVIMASTGSYVVYSSVCSGD